MRLTTTRLWAPILVAAICLPASSAWAQQQQGSQTNPVPPTGPATPTTQGQQDKHQDPASPIATPTTITGDLAPSLSEGGSSRSTLQFGLHADEFADSNLAGSLSSPGWGATTDIGGHLDLHILRRSDDFTLSFTGGAFIYNQSQYSQYDSTYQSVSAAEVLSLRRMTLHLNDQFGYLPESPFGFGGGGLGGLFGGLTLINPNALPDQSALTLQSQRLSNLVLAEADITTGARTSWTITGSYGILHYLQSGFLQPSNYSFGVGYNRTLSAKQTIGVSYRLNLFRYNPNLSSINDQSVLVNYGYQTGGRLSFQFGGGPDFTSFTSLGSIAPASRISWSANAGFTYQYNKTSLQFSAYRFVGGGAGLYLGAETSGFQFSATHPLGRFWTVSASTGFVDSQSLSQTSATNTSYQSWFFGASASRSISRTGSLFARYNYQRELTNGNVCNGSLCLAPFQRQQISVGFSWDMHAIALQ